MKNKGYSRREFINLSALGLASLTILPSWTVNGVHVAPSDRVVLGFIGLGRQGLSDFGGLSRVVGVEVAAGSDVYEAKRQRFKARVEQWQSTKGTPKRCDVYERYEELLERTDIDAVGIATPDHWHALVAIHACQAGKDAYVQKPLAYTIVEGLKMVEVANRTKRVIQVGSQQRSSAEFIKAIELVQTGAIGHVEKIYSKVGDPPAPFNLPEEPLPVGLNWNLWLGPLNDSKIHYHPDLCPPISLNPVENEKLWGAWRWYRETGNGYTADWGAHMFDIAQAAIGMDGSGPCEFIPKGYNGTPYMTMKYLNGVVMTEQPYLDDNPNAQGLKFIGTKGWIEVARGYLACSDQSLVPEAIAGRRPGQTLLAHEQRQTQTQTAQRQTQQRATTQTAAQPARAAYEESPPHAQNFIDCIRSRKKTVAPIEVGCSTNTLCCIANIANELGRPVKWNPATLSFGDDKEAANHRLYQYQYRGQYCLDK